MREAKDQKTWSRRLLQFSNHLIEELEVRELKEYIHLEYVINSPSRGERQPSRGIARNIEPPIHSHRSPESRESYTQAHFEANACNPLSVGCIPR